MLHLLNLLAAIALLVWGTHTVRTGMLRVFGENLRRVLAASFASRFKALLAGLGVTSLVQSSTATCLIVASFVGKGLVGTGAALAVMLGADIGTALMAVVYSFDLSWLSPLLIFVGVVLFVARQNSCGRAHRPRAHRPGADHAGAAVDRRCDPATDRVACGARAAGGVAATRCCSTSWSARC